jgi:signal transduction histidine kinase
MLNFRKKIFLGNFIVWMVFLGILFPFVDKALHILYEHGTTPFVFEVFFVLVIGLIVVVFTVVNQAIVYRFTQPILWINKAVQAYHEGKEEFLPRIVLPKSNEGDEFSKLVFTLNSLSSRIQSQIDHLIRQREETEVILESLDEGVIATDTSARVTFANRVACQLLGVGQEAIKGLSLDAVKAGQGDLSKKCHEMVLDALQTSESSLQTGMLRGSLYLNLMSAPLTHHDGALLVLQDVTSDHKMLRMGQEFIANASHEIRTPLTIIRGFAETLQDMPDLPPEMLRDITEKIVRTCSRLEKLVRSLLTLADIENLSQERLNRANLLLLAENGRHTLLAAHPEVQVSLQCEDEEVPIKADVDLLELAILNLLENAVKYSPAPAEIEMEIEVLGDEAHLHVKDRGIGISESDLPRIFDRFYTVDKARSRKSGGAGLGLSIVKTVVDKHGGKAGVSSELGKGSRFTLILPLFSAE